MAMTPVIPDKIIIVSATIYLWACPLSSMEPALHNATLNTERRIRVPETETEGQEKCWSGTESKGTEKLLWLPNPRPQTA